MFSSEAERAAWLEGAEAWVEYLYEEAGYMPKKPKSDIRWEMGGGLPPWPNESPHQKRTRRAGDPYVKGVPLDILKYDRCPCGQSLWKRDVLARAGVGYCSASCRHKYGRVTLT